MQCDYCKKEFSQKDLGKFKDKSVCYQCSTDKGIPADFNAFLEDTPLGRDGEDPLLTDGKKKEKEKGNLLISFLVSAIIAFGTSIVYFQNRHLNISYIFLAEGILSGLLVRLMQKGRGGNHQNIVAVMVMFSFLFPEMKIIQTASEFDPFAIMKEFIWLVVGVFVSYMLLVEITPAKKK